MILLVGTNGTLRYLSTEKGQTQNGVLPLNHETLFLEVFRGLGVSINLLESWNE
jgi:hypothetical protein